MMRLVDRALHSTDCHRCPERHCLLQTYPPPDPLLPAAPKPAVQHAFAVTSTRGSGIYSEYPTGDWFSLSSRTTKSPHCGDPP